MAPYDELQVVETDEAFVVTYAADTSDWVARFEKDSESGFPAAEWAERMVALFNDQNPCSKYPPVG